MTGDPPSEAEERFLALLGSPQAFYRWAEKIRDRWERTPEGKAAVARCYRDVGGFRQGEGWRKR